MNKSKAIRRRLLKLAFPIFFLSYYFSEVVSGWPLLRHMGLRGDRNFADFYAILESARCKPGSFYPGTNQLCIFPYGSSLRWFLKIIPIPLAHWNAIGWLLIVTIGLLLLLIITIGQEVNVYSLVFYIVIFSSPPIILLLERGNFDAVMVCLVCLAGYSFGKEKVFTGILLIFITTLFKFYTLPLLFLPIFLVKKISVKIASGFAIVASLLTIYFDRSVIFSGTHIGAFAAFGTPVYGSYLKKIDHKIQLNYSTEHIFGLACFVVGLLLAIFFVKRSWLAIPRTTSTSIEGRIDTRNWIYLLTAGTTISCFITSYNFDYRLIYFFIASIVYLQIRQISRKEKYIFALLVVGVAWMNYDVWSFEPFGNTALFILLIFMILDIYRTFFNFRKFQI